jgi:DNA primase
MICGAGPGSPAAFALTLRAVFAIILHRLIRAGTMPLYSDSTLDEVRNAVNIVSLVSEYVALKKRGRNHVARCPFHTEKTPSFNVNEEKQIFHCFGCGVGGDVFKFLMQIEHVSFPEAVRLIADRYGIRLPQAGLPERAEGEAEIDQLRHAMADAATFFHLTLLESDEGRAPLAYLQARGVTRETINRFQLGYSPAGGDVLLHKLVQKGFPLQALEESGLAKRSEDGSRHYDAFRGRIMFPIADLRNRVIAFGGRALGDRPPKYLNSPETRLYNKSRNLFGLSFSREGIKKQGFAVLVEGYMDFIIPFQYGLDNLVASLGTSLTPQQVQLLGRYTREVVVSYDPDSAGLAATQRSLDLFLEEDFRVRVLRLPAGQDPDVFMRSAGPEEYCKRLRESVPYLDFVLATSIQSQGGLENPRSKVQVLNTVLPYLAKLPNAVERSEYVFRFARRLHLEDQQLLAELKRAAQQKKTRLSEASLAGVGAMKFAEKRLLQLLLLSPDLQAAVLPSCSPQDFEGLATERFFVAILEGLRNSEVVTFESLHRRFAGEPEQALLARLQMEEVPESLSVETASSQLCALRAARLKSYIQQIQTKIAEAAQRKDDELLNRLLEQRALVDRELGGLSGK